MGKEHIGNIIFMEPKPVQRGVQLVRAPPVIVRKKLLGLLIAQPGIDQYQTIAVLNKKLRAPISIMLLLSAGLVPCQRALGTTPNMAPPSNLKLPVSTGYKVINSKEAQITKIGRYVPWFLGEFNAMRNYAIRSSKGWWAKGLVRCFNKSSYPRDFSSSLGSREELNR